MLTYDVPSFGLSLTIVNCKYIYIVAINHLFGTKCHCSYIRKYVYIYTQLCACVCLCMEASKCVHVCGASVGASMCLCVFEVEARQSRGSCIGLASQQWDASCIHHIQLQKKVLASGLRPDLMSLQLPTLLWFSSPPLAGTIGRKLRQPAVSRFKFVCVSVCVSVSVCVCLCVCVSVSVCGMAFKILTSSQLYRKTELHKFYLAMHGPLMCKMTMGIKDSKNS